MKKSDPLRRSHHLRKVEMVKDGKLKGKEGATLCEAGDIIMSRELPESLQMRVGHKQ